MKLPLLPFLDCSRRFPEVYINRFFHAAGLVSSEYMVGAFVCVIVIYKWICCMLCSENITQLFIAVVQSMRLELEDCMRFLCISVERISIVYLRKLQWLFHTPSSFRNISESRYKFCSSLIVDVLLLTHDFKLKYSHISTLHLWFCEYLANKSFI